MAESTKARGCFDFMGKKEEKTREDLVMTDLDAAKETTEKEKNGLQRTRSHSISSSEEEAADEGGERKKQKGLKEAIRDKITGDKDGEESEQKETCVCMEKCNEVNAERVHTEEKKGFLEKIIEKLPGQHNRGEEDAQTPAACEHSPGSNTEESKGIIDKIEEKFPGHDKSD